MKELKISAIREGTVIDHIPSSHTFKVAEILSLDSHGNVVSIATNLQSNKTGAKKGIIKIGGRDLTEEEVSKIAVLAPHATVSIIKNYDVKKKFKLKLPKQVFNIIQCNNPKCISNMEKIHTKFTISREKPLRVRCDYCERSMDVGDIKII